jgi:hypothetical protein
VDKVGIRAIDGLPKHRACLRSSLEPQFREGLSNPTIYIVREGALPSPLVVVMVVLRKPPTFVWLV